MPYRSQRITNRKERAGHLADTTRHQSEDTLTLRYGADKPDIGSNTDLTLDEFTQGNPTLNTLLRHKSARHFTPDPLPEGTLERIVACAQSAATSSNLQTWSVVALQDAERKAQASLLCGDQDFIRKAPLFLVFCADLARMAAVSETMQSPGEGLDYMEMFVMATIDASLAGQNAAVAAEAMGLGICYVGGARNHPRELAELLQLPPRVFAVFGMAVGVPSPDDTTTVKPRLPQPEILRLETYANHAGLRYIERYDETMRRFYESQRMTAQGDWTRRSTQRVETPASLGGRHVLRDILQERGFELK